MRKKQKYQTVKKRKIYIVIAIGIVAFAVGLIISPIPQENLIPQNPEDQRIPPKYPINTPSAFLIITGLTVFSLGTVQGLDYIIEKRRKKERKNG